MSVGRRLRGGGVHPEASVRLGARLRELRHEHMWSQQRLAEEAGVSYATVRAVEGSVTSNPGVFTLLSITDALDVSLSDVVIRAVSDVSPGEPE